MAWAKDFKQRTVALKLEISDKSTAVPDCWASRIFVKSAAKMDIPIKASRAGEDIGVDTTSAATRSVKKQRERINACKKKAGRAGFLSRKNRKCRKLAITAIKPAQLYGHTAVGIAPSGSISARRMRRRRLD